MKIRTIFTGLLTLLLGTSLVPAQDAPTITIRKGERVNLILGDIGGPAGGQVKSVLRNDLEIAGVFTFVEGDAVAFTVSGQSDGSRLTGRVVDRSGRTVLNSTYRGDVRRQAHLFADDIVETLTGRKGIAATRIAFVSNRTGQKEIYTADYDGANVQQITRDGVISVAPALSPDGRFLAYTGYQSGYADVYLVDLESGRRNRIINYPGTNSGAAFSPDGSRIALTMSKDGSPELYVTRRDGGGARRLTRTRGVVTSPSWSPDGREILYSSDERGPPLLFRIGAGGGSPRQISTGQNYNTEPHWSPDGNRVAFNTRVGGRFQVAIHELNGGGTRVVTSGGDAEDPVWAPNSRHLLYAQGRALYLLDTETDRRIRVVEGLGQVSEPTWSR